MPGKGTCFLPLSQPKSFYCFGPPQSLFLSSLHLSRLLSLCPSLHLALSPSLPLAVTPSLHLSLSPSLPLAISPSLRPALSPSLHLSLPPSLLPSLPLALSPFYNTTKRIPPLKSGFHRFPLYRLNYLPYICFINS